MIPTSSSSLPSIVEKNAIDMSNVCLPENLPSLQQPSDDVYGVYCNRELNMESLAAIGFDMDYTLAQYNVPEFDNLAFEGARQKLVDMGYPEEVLGFTYNPERWIRGLIIDIKRGNFLKIDKHKYVRVAYHGLDKMSSESRKALYSQTFNKKDSLTESFYVNMDTLFQIVDAELYSQLIHLKDNSEYAYLDDRTYEEMYRDARACVDLCHRDGVIKDEVARDPGKYVVKDPNLVPMLKQYKAKGIKVFLVTNSLWTYTQDVMSYLVDASDTPSGDWTTLFDLIIVGSCKPAFLLDARRDLFRVDKSTGSLTNTDGVYEIAALGQNGAAKFLEKGNVFQNGNFEQLAAMLDLDQDGRKIAGEQILYVGDHLYSDVLRSKRTLGWRTALIVPELEREMKVAKEQKEVSDEIKRLRQLREQISVHSDSLRLAPASPSNAALLEELASTDRKVKSALVELTSSHHAAFNPLWGQLFKSGYEESRFSYYTSNYACIYMAKASNLRFVSERRSFRTDCGDALPHARDA